MEPETRKRPLIQDSQKEPLILIIDDHPHILGLLGDILKVQGYRIQRAADAPEALASVEGCRPDLILLDVLMPKVEDGFAFMEALKQRRICIPMVIITAHLSEAKKEQLAEYVAEGRVQHVHQKPFPPIVTLLEEVDRLTPQILHRK